MFSINGKVVGAKQTANALDRRLPAAMARNRRIYLEKAAAKTIAEVRRGDWFDHESRHGLKSLLQASPPRITKYDGQIDVMWTGKAAVYGPILEHGPKKKRWEIKPRHRTAEGKPVKALRWVEGGGDSGRFGQVRFAKRVIHVDKPSHRRKHIGPTVSKLRGWYGTEQRRSIRDAKYAAGLA